MGKKLLEKPSREELECELVKKIKTLDYECIRSLVKGELKIEHYTSVLAKSFFDWPIPEEEKETQVSAKVENFGSFPDEFLIENIQDIIDENLGYKKYMYIYFVYDGSTIGIALLFKDEYYLGEEVNINEKDNIYIWKSKRLIKLLPVDYPNVILMVREYKTYFDLTYGTDKYSKYIIFSMSRIKKNFKEFNTYSKILVSGCDYHGVIRPNLILETDQDTVVGPVYKPSVAGKLFYNMGHLYP